MIRRAVGSGLALLCRPAATATEVAKPASCLGSKIQTRTSRAVLAAENYITGCGYSAVAYLLAAANLSHIYSEASLKYETIYLY